MGNPSACSGSQCMKNGVIKQKENACHVLSLILILLGPQQPTACISLNICLNCCLFSCASSTCTKHLLPATRKPNLTMEL